MDSGKATKGSPEGRPRWRQRSHTGIDSSENRVFYRNDPFETGRASNVICSGAVHEGASAIGAASVGALGNDKKRIAQRFPGAFHTAFDNRRRCLHGKSVRSRGGDVRRNGYIRISGRGRRGIRRRAARGVTPRKMTRAGEDLTWPRGVGAVPCNSGVPLPRLRPGRARRASALRMWGHSIDLERFTHEMRQPLCKSLQTNPCREMRAGGLCPP